MGQFFTPRNVVRFTVEMMQPNSSLRVLSGGFLLNAMDDVRMFTKQNYTDELQVYNHWNDFAKDFGIEMNNPIARVCQMNMIIYDDMHTNVIIIDSLDNIDRIRSVNQRFQKDHFDLRLTNPPFWTTVKDS